MQYTASMMHALNDDPRLSELKIVDVASINYNNHSIEAGLSDVHYADFLLSTHLHIWHSKHMQLIGYTLGGTY